MPAYETIVMEPSGGDELAYTVLVDAVTGEVLSRVNRLDHLAAGTVLPAAAPTAGKFNGQFTQNSCGPKYAIPVPPGSKSVSVFATAHVRPTTSCCCCTSQRQLRRRSQ